MEPARCPATRKRSSSAECSWPSRLRPITSRAFTSRMLPSPVKTVDLERPFALALSSSTWPRAPCQVHISPAAGWRAGGPGCSGGVRRDHPDLGRGLVAERHLALGRADAEEPAHRVHATH